MRTTIAQIIGKIESELGRKSLLPPAVAAERNGVPPLEIRKPGVLVTSEIVKASRDELDHPLLWSAIAYTYDASDPAPGG